MRFTTLAASILLFSYLGISDAKADECKTPVSVIGASNTVGLKRHVRKYNKKYPKRKIDTKTLVFEDSDPNTLDKILCRKKCDPFAYIGRTIYHLREEIKRGKITKAMNSIDSNIAVILGGVSSINMTDKILKRTLTNMVKTLKKSKKNVYFVEAPYGMVGGQYFNGKKDGHNVFGTVKKENIDRYNKIIRQAGADGIIPFKDAPWRKGKLHGITMEFPKYFVDAVYRSIGKDC